MSGIYIHIPYCSQACHYCDFHFSTNLKTKEEFINCLTKEISMQKDFLPSNKINTIYFGGGTPSILTQKELRVIFDALKSNFQFYKNAEITLESNPDNLSKTYLKMLKSFGINRLSIGIQSFENRFLKYFNRSHNAVQAVNSVKNAQKTGIKNISIDLIYGIPNQSLKDFEVDLLMAIDLDVPHISAYCLTIEEKTIFGKWYKQKKLQPADEKIVVEQFNLLMQMLSAVGYQHYEISNFAKQEYKSQHNSSYWDQSPYIGLGPGAHSYDGINRQYNVSNNSLYVKNIQNNKIPATIEILTTEQKINEFILTQMRTFTGINLFELKAKYGLDLLIHHEKQVKKLKEQKLILVNTRTLKLSKKGKLFTDKITEGLMF